MRWEKRSVCWPGLIRTLDQSVFMVRWLDPPRCTALQVSNCLRPSARAEKPPPNCKARASSCVHLPPPELLGFEGFRGKMAWKRHLLRDGWRSEVANVGAGVDRGFILSDHADWDGLLNIVRNSNAKRVGVTHGSTEAFSRYLREFEGLESFVLGDQRATSDGDDG